jgi:hypothetical protein
VGIVVSMASHQTGNEIENFQVFQFSISLPITTPQQVVI